ncbi:MAG: helix-turn-helix domain-containing protein [Planctomycetia bacterium]
MPPLNYTREQLAELLNVRPQTLAAWACRGCGPRFWKRKRRVFYRAGDVAAWLDDPAGYDAARAAEKSFSRARTGSSTHERILMFRGPKGPEKQERNDDSHGQ